MPRNPNVSIGTDVMRAIGCLCQRDVVLIPSETEYLLACNALDAEAVGKLRSMHSHSTQASLELIVPSFERIGKYAKEIPSAFSRLAARFSPGPITYLLPRRSTVSDQVTVGMEKVALRVPSHPLTLSLLNKLNFPLAVVQLPFGKSDGEDVSEFLEQLDGRIEYVLDGGATAVGPGATVVEMGDGAILVHRVGSVSREAIERVSGLPTYQYLAPMTPQRSAVSV